MLGLWETKRRDLLPWRAGWLRETRARYLRHRGEIAQGELTRPGSPFLDSGRAAQLDGLLTELAAGRFDRQFIKEVNRQVRAEQTVGFTASKERQDRVRKAVRELKPDPATKPDLDGFLALKPVREAYEADVREICARLHVDRVESTLAQILSFGGRYPYTEMMIRLEAAREYWHLVCNRRVDEGGATDEALLTYLVGTDVLVTNDRVMKDLAGLVFPPEKKVRSAGAFLEEVTGDRSSVSP